MDTGENNLTLSTESVKFKVCENRVETEAAQSSGVPVSI